MAFTSIHVKSPKRTLFKESPIILRAYFIFSILVTVALVIQVLVRFPVFKQINPTWLTFFPLSYTFGLYFITALIFSTTQKINRDKYRLAIVGLLSAMCLLGLLLIQSMVAKGLGVSIKAMILSIATMIIWITLLQFPSVITYCKK